MIKTWGFYLFAPGASAMERLEKAGAGALIGHGDTAVTPEEYQAAYDFYVDLWQKCDGWGFDGLVWAEHHFGPLNLSPSPHLLVASIAARTKHMQFTILGSVLGLHDPRRFVEECAMLDYLTGGRFEPGIAPGAGTFELVRAGIPAEQARPRYYGGAEVVRKAFAAPTLTHHDEFTNLQDVLMVPQPRLRPGQSVWVAATSPDSGAWCGERGFKMCTSWLPTTATTALAARYREAAEAAGHPTDPSMLGLRRRIFVADSDAEAQEKYEAASDPIRAMAGQAFETAALTVQRNFMDPDDFAIGSPKTVAERLIEQCRAGGYGHVMALTDWAGFQWPDLLRSHELIGTQVAPLLRSATVSVPDRVAAE